MSIKDIAPSVPADTENAGLGAQRIRETKQAVFNCFPAVDGQISNAGASGDPADTNPPDAATFSALFDRVKALEGSAGAGSVPVGAIMMWSGTDQDIPAGWFLCDGTSGRPNLTDRFVVGKGTRAVNSTGGSLTTAPGGDGSGTATVSIPDHVITVDNLPEHDHAVFVAGDGTNITWPGTGFAGPVAQSHPSADDRRYVLSEGTGEPDQGRTSNAGGVPVVQPLTHGGDQEITIEDLEHTHTYEPSYYALAFIIYEGV